VVPVFFYPDGSNYTVPRARFGESVLLCLTFSPKTSVLLPVDTDYKHHLKTHYFKMHLDMQSFYFLFRFFSDSVMPGRFDAQ